MPRQRDAADTRRRAARRAAHPVGVSAGAGVVLVEVPASADRLVWTGHGLHPPSNPRAVSRLTPTEARALARVLLAAAADVEARAPADLDATIHRGASDEEREPLREVVRAGAARRAAEVRAEAGLAKLRAEQDRS